MVVLAQALGYKTSMQLYLPESVYALDQAAIEHDALSGIELMQRAGERVWRELQARWPQASRISVLAGSGNNGGDAYVVALCARRERIDVQLLHQGDPAKQSATSKHFSQLWAQAGGTVEAWSGQPLGGEVIVDGLLGIGLQRDLDPDWQALIEAINASAAPRVAIDIPSGLNARTGTAQPVAVRAALTVTFIGAKTGQFLADGPDYCGELVFTDLGVSAAARERVEASIEVIEQCRLPAPRQRNSHKNHYGHVLVVGGDQGMSGAVALAASAALRSGAGLVSALVHPDCRSSLGAVPELMVLGWDALDDRLADASVVVIGPGLGDGDDAARCRQRLQQVELPMVIDAGALRADFLRDLCSTSAVITPHPGEAARLLDVTSSAIQGDRLDAVNQLVDVFGLTTVLKGSGSLIAAPGRLAQINTRGNPGMATAGMGDVLAGMIAALLGQGLEPFEAARSAVFIHALCAEAFCRGRDPTGLLASDVIAQIPRVVRRLRNAG